MRKSHLLAVLAAAVLSTSLIGGYAAAQAPVGTVPGMATSPVRPGVTPVRPMAPAARPVTGARPVVALLDISYVFKNHSHFKAMMNDMKADVEQAEAAVKADANALQRMAQDLANYRKGTPEYKQKSEELTKLRANLSVKVQLQKDEFLQREAEIYYTVYQEVRTLVGYYCQSNGIAMVLKFNGEVGSVNDPGSVVRDINKPVIWYDKALDITPMILQELERRQVGRRPGPAPTGPTPSPFNR